MDPGKDGFAPRGKFWDPNGGNLRIWGSQKEKNTLIFLGFLRGGFLGC